jgi:hypothetical protein
MPAETSEHVRLKEIMCQKLEKWFGVSLPEYQSSGHPIHGIAAIVVTSFMQQQQDRQRAREQALVIQTTTYCEKYPDTSTFKGLLDQKFSLNSDNMTFAECMQKYSTK